MTVNVRKVTELTEEDLERIGDALQSAFKEDDFTRVVLGGDMSLERDFSIPMYKAGVLAGEIYVAEDESGKILGTSLWYPPGRYMFDSPEQLAFQEPFRAKLRPDVATWWSDYFIPRVGKFITEAHGENVATNSWHLDNIATIPEARGKGVARALCLPILEKAKRDNAKVTLECETELNVKIYLRLGFTVVAEEAFEFEGIGEFKMWAMAQDFSSKSQ